MWTLNRTARSKYALNVERKPEKDLSGRGKRGRFGASAKAKI
jgi:hypothetical protein